MSDVTVNADDLEAVVYYIDHEAPSWPLRLVAALEHFRAALIRVCPECGKPLDDPAPPAWGPDPVVVGQLTGVRDLSESSVREILRDIHDAGLDVSVRDDAAVGNAWGVDDGRGPR